MNIFDMDRQEFLKRRKILAQDADLLFSKIEKNSQEEGRVINVLNNAIKKQIESNVNSNTIVYLLYSMDEHTYEDHIIHLIRKLDECNIKHIDQLESFPEHSMIGNYMKLICSKFK